MGATIFIAYETLLHLIVIIFAIGIFLVAIPLTYIEEKRKKEKLHEEEKKLVELLEKGKISQKTYKELKSDLDKKNKPW